MAYPFPSAEAKGGPSRSGVPSQEPISTSRNLRPLSSTPTLRHTELMRRTCPPLVVRGYVPGLGWAVPGRVNTPRANHPVTLDGTVPVAPLPDSNGSRGAPDGVCG